MDTKKGIELIVAPLMNARVHPYAKAVKNRNSRNSKNNCNLRKDFISYVVT